MSKLIRLIVSGYRNENLLKYQYGVDYTDDKKFNENHI